jgi:hypothetical protein
MSRSGADQVSVFDAVDIDYLVLRGFLFELLVWRTTLRAGQRVVEHPGYQ